MVADAGHGSENNANLSGVEAFIAPGRARDLGRIGDRDNERSALLDRVEAAELDKVEAAERRLRAPERWAGMPQAPS